MAVEAGDSRCISYIARSAGTLSNPTGPLLRPLRLCWTQPGHLLHIWQLTANRPVQALHVAV